MMIDYHCLTNITVSDLTIITLFEAIHFPTNTALMVTQIYFILIEYLSCLFCVNERLNIGNIEYVYFKIF